MLIKSTLKSLALLCFLALGFHSTSFAQTFWSDTFSDEATATADWENGGTNGGAEEWTWTNDPTAGYDQFPAFGAPTASDGYFLFDSDANDDFAHDVTLTNTGNPADATGLTDVHLRFYTQYAHFSAGSQALVGVSTDGVNFTYYDIGQGIPADQVAEGMVDFAIPEADNASQVYIQFRWIGQYEYHWKVDDVELYTPSAPIYNVTFRVNMGLQTVDPGGVFIAGSFNNFTNQALTNEGNGIWSITLALPGDSTYTYKFKNGPDGWETGTNLAACGQANPFGSFDRVITPTADVVLPAVCFDQCGACVISCNMNPNAIICDDFETYTLGPVSPQAAWWLPWSGNDADAISAEVSSEQHSNGTKSMKVRKDGAGDDQLLLLGTKNTGRYSLKWKMYIPNGDAGYFNIQYDEAAIGSQTNFDGEFFLDSISDIGQAKANQGVVVGTFDFPHGEWFDVEFIFDLDNNLAKLFVDSSLARAWGYTGKLGAIDFYSDDVRHLFYVDQVEYVQLDPIVYNDDICGSAVDLTQYFSLTSGVASTTGLFDNTDATVSPTDPTDTDCFTDQSPLNASQWFTFTGNGGNYHIETVPCNATNYINNSSTGDQGDTEMLIYEGNDCTNLTEIACSEDLYSNGIPDWRAGLDLQTESGQNYYILIDGFFLDNVISLGEYCIEITRLASVLCDAGVVGNVDIVNDGFVCWNGNTNDVLDIDAASFVLPNQGPVYGMAWVLTTVPVPTNTNPVLLGADFLIQTTVVPGVAGFNLPNNGTFNLPLPGQYYVTPLILAGGVDTVADAQTFFTQVDLSNGCLFTGESQPIILLPLLNPIDAVASSTGETFPPGNNGTINLQVEGGFPEEIGDPSFYTFEWSNGATTQNLTGLAGGAYTVTVNDITGCSDDVVLTVDVATAVDDPSVVKSLTVSPNPTRQSILVNLTLAEAAEVRLDLVNVMGQQVQTVNAGKVSTLNQPLDLSSLPSGIYFLHLQLGEQTAVRRVVLQK